MNSMMDDSLPGEVVATEDIRRNMHVDHPDTGPKECEICSFLDSSDTGPVFHRHFSSLYYRQITGAEEANVSSLCPSCMVSHEPYPGNRVKIVVSDSAMHQFYAPPGHVQSQQYSGDSLHIDYLTIEEANLKTLNNAFHKEYLDFPPTDKPMDVVLVAGYQDLLEGNSRNYIIKKMHQFAHMIRGKDREQNKSRQESNSVAIASLVYPPALAWLPDDGPLPINIFRNNTEKIDWLNGEISRINEAYYAVNPPKFHTYGVRIYNKRCVDRFGQVSMFTVKGHRWEHWQGNERSRMLHLSNEKRFRMGIALNNYFRYNT